MVDGAASLASLFFGLQAAGNWSEPRGQNLLDGGAPFYGTYETADGRWVAIGPLEPKFFVLLAEQLGLDERFVKRQYDRRLWPEMREAIATAFKQHPRDEWCRRLEGTDACFAPVLSFAEAPQHAHAAQRGAFVDVAGVVQPGPAPRFGRTPAAHPRPAPQPGQDSEAVLLDAGYSAAELLALRRAGVLA
mgnify:CR=1 FL=1